MNIFRFYNNPSRGKDTLEKPAPNRKYFNTTGVIGTLGLVFFILSISLLVIYGSRPPFVRIRLGDVSKSDIYAPLSFQFPDNDQIETARARKMVSVAPVYIIDSILTDRIMAQFTIFIDYLAGLKRNSENVSPEAAQKEIASLFGISMTPEEIKTLLAGISPAMLKDITQKVESLLNAGITTAEMVAKITENGHRKIAIKNKANRPARAFSTQDLLMIEIIPEDFLLSPDENAKRNIPAVKAKTIISRLLPQLLENNLAYSQKMTEDATSKALGNLPIFHKFVKKGEIIVRRGETITKKHMEKIQWLNRSLESSSSFEEKWQYPAGNLMLAILFAAIFVLFCMRFYRTELGNTNTIMLLSLSGSALVLTSYFVFNSFSLTDFYWMGYIPLVPIVSITIGAVCHGRIAMIFSISLSWIIATICGNQFDLGVTNTITGVVALCFLQGIRKRSMLFWVGLYTGISGFLAQIGLSLLENTSTEHMLLQATGNFFGGLACSAVAMILMPLVENIFHFTTDYSLREICDLNHPLLKKLMLRAPGTYHHSLMIANLAESAAELVGANPLICRAGGYFHDIGKLDKPEYFSENESAFEKSIHEELSPSMSSLIIVSHVRNGIERAKAAKLPKPIIDIISQHHGTGIVYCFFKKAQDAHKDTQEVKVEQFMYPGPRPQTKEAGILMLADIVEAASRSLHKPTPGRIENLVKELINEKFIETQLDECPLTLKDLHLISERFTRMLNAIFHTRSKYPQNEKYEYVKQQASTQPSAVQKAEG